MSEAPQFIEDTSMQKPHVFLLGAGASYAAFPAGDRNGRSLPLMNNLVKTLDLEPLLRAHGVTYTGQDFEELYASFYREPQSAMAVMPPRITATKGKVGASCRTGAGSVSGGTYSGWI